MAAGCLISIQATIAFSNLGAPGNTDEICAKVDKAPANPTACYTSESADGGHAVVQYAGSMVVANRQVQLHALQSQLLQAQSTYAEQVGSNTNLAAPSLVATKAGALHLVYPVSVTQVPSTSLDEPLRLPKFLGYAPATSRTLR